MFFIVLYMLIDGADHLKAVRRLLPKRARLEATQLFHEIAKAHRGWALASFANVCSASILLGAGLYLLDVPGALILGVIAGLGELIPNIGPFLGALPAILLTAIADPEKTPYVVGMFIVVQTIQSYTISPQMLKFSVELPVLVTIISVLVFATAVWFSGGAGGHSICRRHGGHMREYANRHLEKDTEDYDAVNDPVDGTRPAIVQERPSRFRRVLKSRPDPTETDERSDGAASAALGSAAGSSAA